MHTEDLASLEDITEDTVLCELQERYNHGNTYSFVGDVLLYLNPNKEQDIYSLEVHAICSIIFCAFQIDAFNPWQVQRLILGGGHRL